MANISSSKLSIERVLNGEIKQRIPMDEMQIASDIVLFKGIRSMDEIIDKTTREVVTKEGVLVEVEYPDETKIKAMNQVINMAKYLELRKSIEAEAGTEKPMDWDEGYVIGGK